MKKSLVCLTNYQLHIISLISNIFQSAITINPNIFYVQLYSQTITFLANKNDDSIQKSHLFILPNIQENISF